MKKILLLLFVVPMLFNSCNAEDGIDGVDGRNGTNGTNGTDGTDGTDGVDGVNGIDGEDGQDGSNIPELFQVIIDFNEETNFETLVDLPSDVQISPTDIVLVYIAKVISGGLGDPPPPPTIIWEVLPKTMYLENGELTYGFKHTVISVDSSLIGLRIFLDGSVDLNELPSELTQDIIFKIAVIPAVWVSSANMDDLEAMINSIPNNEIKVLN